MTDNLIITIGRQYGSGGRVIGKQIASLLGIQYYDKELLQEAAKDSGLDASFFEKADERPPSSLLHSLSVSWLSGALSNSGTLCNETIFRYQSDVISHIAEKSPCVIVGRCADYILRNQPNCVNIFIHSPIDIRAKQIIKRENIDSKKAFDKIEKQDKNRESYYNFYTDKTWGKASSYHLSIDSSVLGYEGTADFIKMFIEKRIPFAPVHIKE